MQKEKIRAQILSRHFLCRRYSINLHVKGQVMHSAISTSRRTMQSALRNINFIKVTIMSTSMQMHGKPLKIYCECF